MNWDVIMLKNVKYRLKSFNWVLFFIILGDILFWCVIGYFIFTSSAVINFITVLFNIG